MPLRDFVCMSRKRHGIPWKTGESHKRHLGLPPFTIGPNVRCHGPRCQRSSLMTAHSVEPCSQNRTSLPPSGPEAGLVQPALDTCTKSESQHQWRPVLPLAARCLVAPATRTNYKLAQTAVTGGMAAWCSRELAPRAQQLLRPQRSTQWKSVPGTFKELLSLSPPSTWSSSV